ncbi:MAG: PDZ domain-containing protein [Planctomycetota bacterium]
MSRRLLLNHVLVCLAGIIIGTAGIASAQGNDASAEIEPTLSEELAGLFEWRSIGPANMSGRLIDIAVHADNPKHFYLATASGGILKTTNNGVTFEHIFDDQSTVSIGDIAISQTDPDLIWVGTGEHNPRNSVSWGDGVYKSTDGGETWEHKGLRESFQTGKILIHPESDDTVYVGALGRLWGPNEERGLFKTTDGGETWENILYIDDMTGVIDMAFHPDNPDVMLVATWERERDPFDTNDPAKRWGPGSGLYRTTDGGESFKEITTGLPATELGRMHISFSGTNADTVYLLVDTDKIGSGIENPGYLGVIGEDAEAACRITRILDNGPAKEAGFEQEDLVIAVNGERVLRYDDLIEQIQKRQAGSEATFEVVRDGEIIEIDVEFIEHPDPDETPFGGFLGGQAADIQDLQGDDGIETGGLFQSDDGGKTWRRINSINPRPMYFSKVYSDPSDDNYMWVLGVQLFKSEDNGSTWSSDGIPPEVHVDHHSMWINPNDGEHMMLCNDGGLYVTYDRGETWDHFNHAAIGQFYHVGVDNQPLYNVYGGLQDNGSWGAPNRARNGQGTLNSDWFRVGGGDGFICYVDASDPDQVYYSSQNGGLARVNFRTGDRASLAPREPKDFEYRWNWKTPYMLSHHNPRIYYAAGNYVFRSFNKGDDIKRISPEIVRTRRGAASAFDESPIDPNLLMVGSNDGALWVSRDGGDEWENLIFPYDETAYPEEDEEDEDTADSETGDEANAVESDTPAEDAETQGGDRFARMLAQADTSGDGKLQKSEAPEQLQRFFSMVDRNKDDELDGGELETVRNMMARMSGGTPAQATEPQQESAPEPETQARTESDSEDPAPSAQADDTDRSSESQPEPGLPWEGDWDVTINSDQGSFPLFLTLRSIDETTVGASIESSFIEEETESGSIDDEGNISLTFRGRQGLIDVTAALMDDELGGTIGIASFGFQADWTATRSGGEDVRPSGPPLTELVTSPKRVSSIEWSKFEEGRVYITLDGHYYNDDAPHVFVSEDSGESWASITANLPTGNVRVIREDVENADLLYLGTEFGLFASIDRGASWTNLSAATNLPTVAIHEIAQHKASGDIIAGTHGRSIWVLDGTPLRQMSAETLSAPAHLYAPNDVVRWRTTPSRGRGATRGFNGENPPSGAQIFYSLGANTNDVQVDVYDASGRPIRRLELPEGSGRTGLHRIEWDLRRAAPNAGGESNARFRRGPLVSPGTYKVVLRAGGQEMSELIRIQADPTQPGVVFAEDSFNTEVVGEEEGDDVGASTTPY